MADYIKDLVDILTKQNLIYEKLLDISKHKTDIIIKGLVKDLEFIVKEEQALISAVSKMETDRQRLMNSICLHYGLSRDSTLSDLEDKLDSDDKHKLEDTKSRLTTTLKELSRVNKENGNLIEQSLEYIDFNVNLLSGATADSNYSASIKDNVKTKNIFDTRG